MKVLVTGASGFIGKNVLLAGMAQQMDRSRMQAIRYFEPECLPGTGHRTQLSIATA